MITGIICFIAGAIFGPMAWTYIKKWYETNK